MKRWKSFTLIEMLITLSLFSMVMLVIYSLMGTTLGLMDKMIGGDANKTSALIFSKVMEKTAKESYLAETVSPKVFRFLGYNREETMTIISESNCTVNRTQDGKLISSQVFRFTKTNAVQMKVVRSEGKCVVFLTIDVGRSQLEKAFLLNYTNMKDDSQ